jgi:hypothetical protein
MAAKSWGEIPLNERYQSIKSGLTTTLPGTSISLASAEQDERLSAEVSSILHQPFDSLSTTLAEAGNWCLFMPLHFNIKACTYEQKEGAEILNVYSGRKHYQSPDESYQMSYRFEVVKQTPRQLSLLLSAARGPASTRDYRIELHAQQVAEGTLLYIRSSYRPSTLSTLLTRSYLATLGRNKVGFSRVTKDGETQLVRGIRGVIERNVMRYHLAIDAFLNSATTAAREDHELMLERWFQLNDRHPQQLHEMTQAEYMKIKKLEWHNQQQLQLAMDEKIRLAAAAQKAVNH